VKLGISSEAAPNPGVAALICSIDTQPNLANFPNWSDFLHFHLSHRPVKNMKFTIRNGPVPLLCRIPVVRGISIIGLNL
jgi:hypothetical protein